MKNLNLKLAGAIIFSLLSISTFAQVSNWKLGGNNNNPPSAVNATNNILGTNINIPLRIHTNGTERFRITEWGSIQGWAGQHRFRYPQYCLWLKHHRHW